MYVSAASIIKDDSGVHRGGVLLKAFVCRDVLIDPLKIRVVLLKKQDEPARKVVSGQLIWADITKNTILC